MSPDGAQKSIVAQRRVFMGADKSAGAVVGLEDSGDRIEDKFRGIPHPDSGEAGVGEFTTNGILSKAP